MGIGAALRKIAPAVSTILGVAGTGTGIPLLSIAANTISEITGKPVKPDVGEIEDVINRLSPDQLLQLKEKDKDVELQLQKLGFENVQTLAKIDADDRASAREREKVVRDKTPQILAYSVVALVIAIDGWGLIHGFSANTAPVLIGRIQGTLDAALVLVLSYYFGSSFGSQRRTDVMAQVTSDMATKAEKK